MNAHSAQQVKLLEFLPAREQEALRAECEKRSLKAGEILFRQGEDAHALYMVVSGTMGIFLQGGQPRKRLLALIGKDEVLGELSMIDGERRSASAIALRDSELLRIHKDRFEELLKKYPAIAVPLNRVLAGRLREATANNSVRLRPKVLTFIAASSGIDITKVAEQLADRVRTDCNETVFIQRGKTEDWNSARLSELESRYDLVFLCCKLGENDWMRSCARQSERICLVTDFSSQPSREITRNFLEVQHDHQMIDLFILHDTVNVCPLSTQTYLDHIDTNRHFHIRKSVRSDWSRWGRIINGRGIGLVLSGGGARAYAHIGILRALTEANMPIDFVGGSSMGAIIAACYAMGQDIDEIERSIERCFVKTNPLSDYTLPLQGLVRGKKVERLLKENFGTLEISDMWLPFFCVSTNLTTASSHVHETGKVWQALRASISLPGILPPVVSDDGVLVDGGVINNLPTIEMSSRCFGPILALDVSRDLAITPKSWKEQIKKPLLYRMFRPPLISLLMRTGTVSGQEQLREQTEAAYLSLNPPLGQIDIRDWKAYEETVNLGYNYMKEQLATNDRLKGMCKICGVFDE